MSNTKKSRSILGLPTKIENKELPNEAQKSLDRGLRDDISKDSPGTPINVLSTNSSDLEKEILDLGIKISGLSSSSSLSWSEEYESEITKKVQLKLEKLDRIFQGIEIDPSPYDLNEIAEWKRYFPHLYILGHNTPTNSAENSEADSEDEVSNGFHQQRNFGHRHTMFPRNRSSLVNKKRTDVAGYDSLIPVRNFNSLPRKPRSLEVDKYLKISSIKSPDRRRTKQTPQSHFNKQPSRELTDDASTEYTSLPFITATPMKTQVRKRDERNKPSKVLFLPPIENTFRSISATPRQVSSKSMFNVPLGNERNSSKKISQAARLKSDLMKLFDHIPISNR